MEHRFMDYYAVETVFITSDENSVFITMDDGTENFYSIAFELIDGEIQVVVREVEAL